MSSVLVTGAGGFVGVPVVRELLRRGHEVHALSRHPPRQQITGVRWHRLDLEDGSALDSLMSDLRPQRLVHLAWYVEHGRFWNAAENVLWVESSLRLMRAFARTGGRRAVILGTCAEYDWAAADRPLLESGSAILPATLYGVAKDALRRVAGAYAERERFELAWGRLFFLYGPGESAGRLVSSVIRALLAHEPIETTSGKQRRDFMYVDDVGRAVVELLDSTLVGPVNIASGEAIALTEVVDLIARALGCPELVRRGALADPPGEPPLLVGDVALLRDRVGFTPRVGLQQGIAETISWWRQAAGYPRG